MTLKKYKQLESMGIDWGFMEEVADKRLNY